MIKTAIRRYIGINAKHKIGLSVLIIGITLVFFAVVLPAIIFPQNTMVVDPTGNFQVSSRVFTYIDKARVESYTDTGENRKLNVQFWYPAVLEGNFPLVVFSHGGLGTRTSNESLYHELASHGYVVSSIDHTYQCFFTKDVDGIRTWIDSGYVKELFAEDAQSNIEQSLEYYQKWMKVRTGDIDFVIDQIIREVNIRKNDTVYKLIDQIKIAAMGHSLGGSAALGIGRIRNDVSAVIALESPFMYDIKGVEKGQFIFTAEPYPVPVLNIYSDSSWNILAQRPQYAANYAMLSDPGDSTFNIHIRGVGHLGLTDFALTSPFLTRILDRQKFTAEESLEALKTINTVCLEFLDRYLK